MLLVLWSHTAAARTSASLVLKFTLFLDMQTKADIRAAAHENRKNQPDKDSVSAIITDNFMQLPEYEAARTVMFYVDVRDEVRTRHALPAALATGKRIVVPYCVDGSSNCFGWSLWMNWSLGCTAFLSHEPNCEWFQRRNCNRLTWI